MIEMRKCCGLYCEHTIPAAWALCEHHFKLVPAPLRDAVSRAFNRYRENGEQSNGFYNAVHEMNSWIRADAEVNEKPRTNWDLLVATTRARDAARAERRREAVKAKTHLTLVP